MRSVRARIGAYESWARTEDGTALPSPSVGTVLIALAFLAVLRATRYRSTIVRERM
jgi:hypothetical protein